MAAACLASTSAFADGAAGRPNCSAVVDGYSACLSSTAATGRPTTYMASASPTGPATVQLRDQNNVVLASGVGSTASIVPPASTTSIKACVVGSSVACGAAESLIVHR